MKERIEIVKGMLFKLSKYANKNIEIFRVHRCKAKINYYEKNTCVYGNCARTMKKADTYEKYKNYSTNES